MLAARVAAGELPPAEERLPNNPAVREPNERIGRYGGTLRVLAVGDLRHPNDLTEYGAVTLARTRPDGALLGNLAETVGDDAGCAPHARLRDQVAHRDQVVGRVPLYFEDVVGHEDVGSGTSVHKDIGKITVIGDATIRLQSKTPVSAMALHDAAWLFYEPKQYLKRWHIRYNPNANSLATAGKVFALGQRRSQRACRGALSSETHVRGQAHAPCLETRRFIPHRGHLGTQSILLEGRHGGPAAPYIGPISSRLVTDDDLYALIIIAGDVDIASTKTRFDHVGMYHEGARGGDYRVATMMVYVCSPVA